MRPAARELDPSGVDVSSQVRLTAFAALASVLTGCALLPLVSPSGWLAQAALLVVAQGAVGLLGRRAPLPRPVTVLLQCVTLLVLLVFGFARDVAPLGFVPSPDAVVRLGDLLATGGDDVSQYQTPAPVTDGIRLILVGGVALIALLVDVLAVTLRSAASAGLPLLGLYSVAAGLTPEGESRWQWFLLGSAGFLTLLLADGRDRLSRWGRVFSGGAPAGRGLLPGGASALDRSSRSPVRTGRRIAGVTLGIAVLVPLALPSLGDGVIDTDRPGGGGVGGGQAIAVNPLVSMQDSLNQPQNREVMKYRTSAKENSDVYLRIMALDEFDGTTWRPAERELQSLPPVLPDPPGLTDGVNRTEIRTSVATAGWYRQDALPMPYPATAVDASGDWRYEPLGQNVIGDEGQRVGGMSYQVSSLVVRPTAEQLAGAPPPSKRMLDEYTKVPGNVPDVVAREARRITRGAANDYERAMALQEWFTGSGRFVYNTEVDSGVGERAIERFLEKKEGFCVHFSFTMAAMARTLGIPARVAVGYVPGTSNSDGTYSVGLQDAHAWPELYFEGVGWARFEPTPSRGNTPDYAQEQTENNETSAPTTAPDPTAEATRGATQEPVCDARAQRAGECTTKDPLVAGGSSSGGPPTWPTVAKAAGPVLLLLALLLPVVWRRRLRTRRLGTGRNGGAPDNGELVTARTLAAWLELLDTAWDFGVLPDHSETPRRAAARIIRESALEGDAADAARRTATAVEQVLYAPAPKPPTGLAADVRVVIAALGVAAPSRVRFRALFLPRSLARVRWAAADRWSRGTSRVAAALRGLPRPSRLRQSGAQR